MDLGYKSHTVNIICQDSKSEMTEYLNKFGANKILLGEDAEYENNFFTVSVASKFFKDTLGIGIISEGHGLQPKLLSIHKENILIIGYNKNVSAIIITEKKIMHNIGLNSLFFDFIFLEQEKIILVVHETGVVALNEKMQELWKFDDDIITDYQVENEYLKLKFMCSLPVQLSIREGKIFSEVTKDGSASQKLP